MITPWNKLHTTALSLLRRILEPDSTKRITVKQIIEHKWCNAKLSSLGMCCDRFATNRNIFNAFLMNNSLALSQLGQWTIRLNVNYDERFYSIRIVA